MDNKKVSRIVLKEDDILLIQIPMEIFHRRNIVRSLYEQIKKTLIPRRNKVLLLPDVIDISVIGKKEIKEHVTDIDLWDLWDTEKTKETLETLESIPIIDEEDDEIPF